MALLRRISSSRSFAGLYFSDLVRSAAALVGAEWSRFDADRKFGAAHPLGQLERL